jgi:hypothetical protein
MLAEGRLISTPRAHAALARILGILGCGDIAPRTASPLTTNPVCGTARKLIAPFRLRGMRSCEQCDRSQTIALDRIQKRQPTRRQFYGDTLVDTLPIVSRTRGHDLPLAGISRRCCITQSEALLLSLFTKALNHHFVSWKEESNGLLRAFGSNTPNSQA